MQKKEGFLFAKMAKREAFCILKRKISLLRNNEREKKKLRLTDSGATVRMKSFILYEKRRESPMVKKANREIHVGALKIHGNSIEFGDTVVQLSNVSLVSTEDVEHSAFPIWVLLGVLAGIVLLSVNFWIGILCVLVCGIILYGWYREVQQAKASKRLVIVTNAGKRFPIVFQDEGFLKNVLETIKELIANPEEASDVVFNISTSKMEIKKAVFKDHAALNNSEGVHQ